MGLITKAMEKVEKKPPEPPVVHQTPTESEPQLRRGRKRFLFLAVPLLVVVVASALGYFFFLKPAPDTPADVPRRSISARKTAATGEKAKDVGKPNEGKTTESGAPQKTPAGKAENQKPDQRSAVVTKSKPIQVKSESQSAAQEIRETSSGEEKKPASAPLTLEKTVLSKTSEPTAADKGSDEGTALVDANQDQTLTSELEASVEAALEFLPQAEEKAEVLGPTLEQMKDTQDPLQVDDPIYLPAESASEENDEQDSEWYMEEDTAPPLIEESPAEEMASVHLTESTALSRERALQISNRSESRAERYFKKGVSYQQQGEIPKAMESYRMALNYNPDHLQANMNLATAYLQTGRFKQAEQILVYLYASRPKDSRVLYNFGVLLYQTGEHESAENKLKKLLEVDPFHLEANLLLATIYEEKGEMDKALGACMKAHQINSTHPRVIYRLGRVCDLAGQTTEAVTYYQQFLNGSWEREPELELAVRHRLKYLAARREER
jgi:tetratricopeptide (TPR) repeat protein